SASSTMSTARTTPAQKPRGRTLSKTFPLSVCIIILMNSFRRLYHTLLMPHVAPAFDAWVCQWPYSRVRLLTLPEVAKGHVRIGSCCICIPGNCSPWGVWPVSPGNTCGRGCSWDGRTCRAEDDCFSWLLAARRGQILKSTRRIVLD